MRGIGQGSEFVVRLPIVVTTAAVAGAGSDRADGRRGPPHPCGR